MNKRLLLICALTLFGCGMNHPTKAGYQAKLDRYNDASTDQLVKVWGAPDKSYALRDGGTALYYLKSSSKEVVETYSTPHTIERNGKLITELKEEAHLATITKQCETTFFANPYGRIIDISFEGDLCVAREKSTK